MGTEFFWTVLFGAFVVESIVNIVKSARANLSAESESASVWYWVSLLVGLGVGVVVALNYEMDVFALVGIEGQVPAVGAVLTGLIISRGSNVASDVIGRLSSYNKGQRKS